MKIAMVGTRGVPAHYGGFETCVEEVGTRLAANGHEVVVYCRGGDTTRKTYQGMTLVHLPAVRRRALETLSHTALSVAHVLRQEVDVALVFNAANSPLLPVLRAAGIPVATHVDGLEWMRAKWGGAGRRYYRRAESLAVRWSDALIADAEGISDYYRAEFGAPSELIAYGAPVVGDRRPEALTDLGLHSGEYHLVVARFEPENHVDMIVEGYVGSRSVRPLVVVGSAPYATEHTERIHALGDSRVRFLSGVWDQDLLDQLYVNAATYLHGHSVGGTNPSLLRAMGAGTATNAFDVRFNREVLGDSAGRFFRDADGVTELLHDAEDNPDDTEVRGKEALVRAEAYDWDDVAGRYEALCARLVATDVPQRRPSGRRLGAGTAALTQPTTVQPPATVGAP